MIDISTQHRDVLRPRRLLHRGVIQARALWFDLSLMSEATARHRVLDMWRNGALVTRFDDGLLLLWPSAERVVCEVAPALPLTEDGVWLLSAPLSQAEKAQLRDDEKRAPLSVFILVRDGQTLTRALSDGAREDVARWLDVSSFAVQSAQTLGEAPAAPLDLAELGFDARLALTGQEPDAQLQRVLEALRGQKTGEKSRDGSAAKSGFAWPQLPPLRGLAASLWGAFDGVRPWQKVRDGAAPIPLAVWIVLIAVFCFLVGGGLRWFWWIFLAFWTLRQILPAIRVAREATPVSTKPKAARGEGESALTMLFKAPEKSPFNDLLARMIMRSRLGNLVGRRHARYILEMMEMFERGDWDAALRHAVPLGKDGDRDGNPFLGQLRARQNLNIAAGTALSSSSIGFGEELSTRLRALYRRSFENLKERGRVEEAAFVLAELLQSDEEAVAFLEEHDRKFLAAEMAEARDLPPGLAVRQWFVAGEEARAIQVARRHNAFADAVFRLEQRNDERAEWLRVLWARALGQSGQYAAAVEALWPVETLREASRAYAELALQSGGESAARTLARLLQLDPDALHDADLRHRVLDLLQNESEEGARSRLGFAKTLRGNSGAPLHNNATQNAARLAVRALLRDAANGFPMLDTKAFNALIDLARDSALRADVPALPHLAPRDILKNRATPLDFDFAADDCGTFPLLDAAWLPDGKCVVALGEAGALLVNRDGKIVHRFDQPCHKIVVSDNGDRAIVLAPRGTIQTGVNLDHQPENGMVYRLARLDFTRKTSRHWCEAVVGAHAESYDGSLWYASVGRELCAIDALNDGFAALWKSGDTGGEIVCVARNQTHLSLLTHAVETRDGWGRVLDAPREKWERWTFDLTPKIVLRQRAPETPEPLENVTVQRRVDAVGQTFSVFARRDDDATPPATFFTLDGSTTELVPPPKSPIFDTTQFAVLPPTRGSANWHSAAFRRGDDALLYVLYSPSSFSTKVVARILLEGAANVSIRFSPNHLTIADNRGRLLVLDLENGALIRNLRL